MRQSNGEEFHRVAAFDFLLSLCKTQFIYVEREYYNSILEPTSISEGGWCETRGTLA